MTVEVQPATITIRCKCGAIVRSDLGPRSTRCEACGEEWRVVIGRVKRNLPNNKRRRPEDK